MPAEFVAREQSLLNVLIEGTERDSKPRRRLLCSDKAIIVGGYFFPSRNHERGGIGAGGPEKRGGFSAEPPFVGGTPHEEGRRAGQ